MAYDPLNDSEFDAIKSRIDAAEDEDTTDQLAADIGARREAAQHPVSNFVTKLPKNIGIGAWKALYNTVDTISDVAAEVNPQAAAAKIVGGEEMRQQVSPSLSELHPEFMKSLRDFTSSWERNDNLSDDITQGVAQFALPFMGWLKLAGGLGGGSAFATAAKATAAEAATAGSAFDPHDGRVADLLEMGRESETRFGTLLRKIAPDESLINHYIDYMTNREGEGAAEGRWKNAVDAVTSSAAVAGLLKGVAVAHKGTKILVNGAIDDLTTPSSFGPGKQKGMVAFHGTPHDFESFDLSKLGAGEGHQTFGHGLYFAEEKDVASKYRARLSGQKFAKNSPMDIAFKSMEQYNWDAKQTYTSLMQSATKMESANPETAKSLRSAAEKIKAGNVKQLGKLMTVDIDDAAVAKMLDYDKALREQPDILKKIPAEDRAKLEDMLEENDNFGDLSEYTGNQLQQLIGKAIEEDRFTFQPSAYDGNVRKYAAEYLLKHDIPGIRYLDGKSRKAGEGTRNIVLFDDKLVKITKKD